MGLIKVAGLFKQLMKNKVKLTPEERKKVMESKAVWHFHHSGPTPAVWKSVDKNGKVTFGCNTHRAYNISTTLKGAIGRFHKFVKGTA
jgi:hypothetical protein